MTSIREFMVTKDPLFAEKKKSQIKRSLTGLMRRIVTNTDGRIIFTEFAKLVKPVDLKPYLKRIRKYTKEEKKQVEVVKKMNVVKTATDLRTGLRKPLTAFHSSEVMLDRDPERHVGLMPVKYGTRNELLDPTFPSESTGN